MSYHERHVLTNIMHEICGTMLDCSNPSLYLIYAKAHSSLSSAAVMISQSELGGGGSFFLPMAAQCVADALKYSEHAFNAGGPSHMKAINDLLGRLPAPYKGVPAPKDRNHDPR